MVPESVRRTRETGNNERSYDPFRSEFPVRHRRTIKGSALGAVVILALAVGSALRQEWEIARLQLMYMLVDAIRLGFRRHSTVSIDRLLEFGIFGSKEAP